LKIKKEYDELVQKRVEKLKRIKTLMKPDPLKSRVKKKYTDFLNEDDLAKEELY